MGVHGIRRILMETAYICDAIRTPIGRYGGTLAAIRTDDLAAIPISALMKRNASVDWGAVDEVVFGCANQAGEDNRNVARMALLLSGLPKEVPGTTVNRLCGSSMDSVGTAARATTTGDAGGPHQEGRSGVGDCRRRREDVGSAVRQGQGGQRLFALH